MSNSKKVKSNSIIEDVEMFPPEEENKNNLLFNSNSVNEILVSDSSLRNLYHLGYNSRSLTKTIINSIKFSHVITSIKSYLDNDDLSIRVGGPLLLGLTRVYDKQIKLLHEDLTTMFQIKRGEKNNSKDDNNVTTNKDKNNKSKKKNQVKTINIESTQDQSYSVNRQVNSSYFNNNILSMSPLNEGLFSILNKDQANTPSKYLMSESAQKSPNIGMFRAQNDSSAIESKNKLNLINSNFKNSNGMIMEKSIFEEENQDMNNFFQFISENVQRDFVNNDERQDFPEDLNFEFNISDSKFADGTKLIFNSDTKTLMNFDIANFGLGKNASMMVNLKDNKENKQKKINTIFVYDEDIEMNTEEMKNEKDSDDSKEVLNKYKSKAILHLTDYTSLLDVKEMKTLSEIPKRSEVFNLNNEQHDDTLVNNFSNLDFKEVGFNEDVNLKEKLNKILEEEKEEKEENNFDNFNENNDLPNFNNIDNFENNFPQENSNNQVSEKFIDLVSSVLKNEKNKKKETSFKKLTEKINEFPPHQIFYNLLCIAQKDFINLRQDEIFKYDSVIISPY